MANLIKRINYHQINSCQVYPTDPNCGNVYISQEIIRYLGKFHLEIFTLDQLSEIQLTWHHF